MLYCLSRKDDECKQPKSTGSNPIKSFCLFLFRLIDRGITGLANIGLSVVATIIYIMYLPLWFLLRLMGRFAFFMFFVIVDMICDVVSWYQYRKDNRSEEYVEDLCLDEQGFEDDSCWSPAQHRRFQQEMDKKWKIWKQQQPESEDVFYTHDYYISNCVDPFGCTECSKWESCGFLWENPEYREYLEKMYGYLC
jgi:hypothetical protein